MDLRRATGRKAAATTLASAFLAVLVMVSSASAVVMAVPTTREVCASGCTYGTIQAAVDAANPGDTVNVHAGDYNEDVLVNKTLTLQGAGESVTTISGPIGGDSSTVHITAAGVIVDGFTITRDGNNTTDWNNPGLNSAGVSIQGQGVFAEVRNSKVTRMRTGIDVNNSNGNSIHNNVIDDNRTGMIFRNQTDNTTVTENEITNNWTAGVLFLDGSNNSNSPVQTAANSNFSGNKISGNWWGGIVDRQTDTNLPAPGQSPKNFSANWFGTQTPVVTTANTTEPGYAGQIPVEFGGTAVPPGGQPDIAGPASANFDYTPLLRSGTDTAPGTFGFQGDFTQLDVHTGGTQTGAVGRVQEGVNLVASAGTVNVRAGTYVEDVTANKAVTLLGAGLASTTISGAIGGSSSTGIFATAAGVVIDGFTITRQGNNTTDWNDPTLNSAGVAVQGQTATVEVRNSRLTGNRTGIDVNNSNGNSVHNNVIDDNRTGMIFRNQTDNTSVTQNKIVNNWTVGVLFLDGSGGTNSPVQTAANSPFTNNDISGNWYGQIADRQTGGSLPAPGGSLKNFSGNWFGTQTPVVTTNNTTEPGYAAQIPPTGGGTAAPPGGQPDIAGPASANFDYTPLLRSGTDTAPGTLGFQGDFSDLTVTAAGAQTGSTGRIEEGVNRTTTAGTVRALAGTYSETDTISKHVHLIGAGNTTVIDPPANGPALSIAAGGTQADPLSVSLLKTTGAGGTGNAGTGIAIKSTVSDVTLSQVRSTGNTGHGVAFDAVGSLTRLRLDRVESSLNDGDGLRFPTSMTGLDGLTIENSHFDLNGFAGMEILTALVPSPGAATNVTVTGSSFDRNENKGIYAERLSNALFDGISVDQSGVSGGFAAGIDLNLKKQAFSNIEIKNSQITRSGTGDPTNGLGLAIKARDDGSNGPTTLTGVSVHNNDITGNQLGIRIGEPGKNNPGPTGVQINRNNISGNVNGNGITNVTNSASPAVADVTCNWFGAASGPGGSGPGTGNTVGAALTFDPWLRTSDLTATCHAPVAVADVGSIAEDGTLNGTTVLGNDSDPESKPLTAVKVTNPAHGTVTLAADGTYTYIPAANYNGPDSFTYKANNGSFDSNVVAVALTVTAVNDAPVAVNDTGSVAEDGVLNGSTVLVNDTDIDGGSLTAAKVTDPAHGTVTVNSDGTYSYTPAGNYNGPDSFTYKANDGATDSTLAATVAITVTPVNDAPVAVADAGTVAEDGTLAGASVLGNDTDADNQQLTAVKVTDPSHGTLFLASNGQYTYKPDANYNGSDSFTYKANDGSVDSNTVAVAITVTPQPEAPVANGDVGSVAEDGTLNGATLLGNDTDAENDSLTAAKASDPAHGTVTVNSDGTYVYTPATNYNGPDSFTYKANDGSADSNAATVSITVNAVNDAPVATADAASVNQDQTLTVNAAGGVLANDSDVDGPSLTASKVGDPAHGTVTLNADGSYVYTPAAGYSGPDSFVYQASDGSASSNAATVSITVIPAQQQPGGPDEIKPVISAATLTNKIFRVNAAGIAEPLAAARAKKGTTFVYTLSEDSRVLFTIESKQKGRKVGTKCKQQTKANKTRRSCTRYVKVGSFGQNGKTGVNRKTFSGKIGTKSLKPGTYRATLRATDAAGNASALKRLSFKVVRR